MKKLVIFVSLIGIVLFGTLFVAILTAGSYVHSIETLLNCRTDFFCQPVKSTPTPLPSELSCVENGAGMAAGEWIEQFTVSDPRSGGGTICVTNISGAKESELFAQEVLAGKLLQSRILWNSNRVGIERAPYVGAGDNGFLYLFIPVRVFYSDGSFTMTQGLLLSEELPTPADLLCQRQGQVWDEGSHSCHPAPTAEDVGEKLAASMGMKKIPGKDAFTPGEHFWVGPTTVFGQLHEYIVGKDGSIMDSTGVVSPAYNLTGQLREIDGPDGTPWFRSQVLQTSHGVMVYFDIIPGHAGWISIK